MKIDSKINKRVNESVANCRKVITEATIELLKKIGVNRGEFVSFGKIMIFYQMKDNLSETITCDRISYCDDENGDSFFLLYMSDKPQKNSYVLSLSNLQYVYNEVRRLVREK